MNYISDIVKKKKKALPLTNEWPIVDTGPGISSDWTPRKVPALEMRPGPNGTEVLAEDPSTNSFTARNWNPERFQGLNSGSLQDYALGPPDSGYPGMPMEAAKTPALNYSNEASRDAQFQKELGEYQKNMAAPSHKQGLGSQILFQVFQGMQNFARAYNNQPMEQHRMLGDVKAENRRNEYTRQFAPKLQAYQAEVAARKERAGVALEELKGSTEASRKQNIDTDTIGKTVDAVAKAQAIGREQNQFEYEERGGKKYQRRKGTNEPWAETSGLPVERSKEEVEVVAPDGSVRYTTSEKALQESVKLAQAEAQQAVQDGRIRVDEAQDYEKKVYDWSVKETKRKEEAKGIEAEAESEYNSAAELSKEIARLESERDEFGDPIAANQNRISELRKQVISHRAKGDTLSKKAKQSKPIPKPSQGTRYQSLPKGKAKKVSRAGDDPMGLFQQ